MSQQPIKIQYPTNRSSRLPTKTSTDNWRLTKTCNVSENCRIELQILVHVLFKNYWQQLPNPWFVVITPIMLESLRLAVEFVETTNTQVPILCDLYGVVLETEFKRTLDQPISHAHLIGFIPTWQSRFFWQQNYSVFCLIQHLLMNALVNCGVVSTGK